MNLWAMVNGMVDWSRAWKEKVWKITNKEVWEKTHIAGSIEMDGKHEVLNSIFTFN